MAHKRLSFPITITMPPTANKVYKLINVESTTLLTLDVDLKGMSKMILAVVGLLIIFLVNGRHDIDKANQKVRLSAAASI